MSSTLDTVKEQLMQIKARNSSLRDRFEAEAAYVQGTAAMGVAAYAFGALEKEAARTAQPMVTVAGLPPALTWGVGAIVAGRVVDGRAGELLADAGRALVTIHAYKTGRGIAT